MAKKSSIKVRLVPESKPDSAFFYYVKKPATGEKAKIKLKLIRQKIDKLDDKLLNLIKIRTNLVNGVLKQKRFKNQIIDKARMKEILTSIKKKSISRKIDSTLTKRIWKNMIRAYIDFEKRNFKVK